MSNESINIGSANSSPEQFQLRYISISKYEGDWQSLPHTHHFSELFYVLRGEGAFYIEKCLISIMSQSLTSGVECIFVNDCTKDESINIAQKLIDESRGNIKFRIINREENGEHE